MGLEIGYKDKIPGLNANSTSTVTSWIKVANDFLLTFYIEAKTGSHDTHEFIIEVSPDGAYNGDMLAGSKVVGVGKLSINIEAYSFFRFKCSVAQGGTSTVDIYAEAFRNT